MIELALLAALGATAGLLLFALFVHLERTGRAVAVVGVILATVVVDAATFPGFERPGGLLHPSFGGLSFRLPELLIALAIAARVAARQAPRSIGVSLLPWVVFTLWYAGSGVIGLVTGNRFDLVIFEAKVLVYLVGGLALAAGVPAADYLRVLPTWLRRAAIGALVMVVLDQAGVSLDLANPIQPLEQFGEIGGDAASIFAALGVLSLVLGAAQRRGRGRWLLTAAPLLLAPFTTEQRAALVGLAVAMLVVVLAWAFPIAHRGLVATPTEVVIVVLGGIAFLILPVVGSAVAVEQAPVTPFTEELTSAFTSRAKAQSAESRENQWNEATLLVAEHPLVGHGLGKEYWYYEQGPDEMWQSNITHNIGFDVAMRSGLLGLAFLLVAFGSALVDAARSVVRQQEPEVIALALACVSLTAGLLAKGMVESILEKYLLATTLGLLLGIARAASTHHAASSPSDEVARHEWSRAWS